MAKRLSLIEGVRPAERGEFTKRLARNDVEQLFRAFYNGKMDLEQVHGLRHLIYAETERQRKLSYDQMKAGEHIRVLRLELGLT